MTQFRDGALMGTRPGKKPSSSKWDRTTMTQDDIDNGRLICIIGVAPVKPAEFVIFRRKGGFEPPRSCERQPLKLVRLPVPPLPR